MEKRGERIFFFFAMGRSRGVVATGGGRALGKKNLEVANVPLFFSFYVPQYNTPNPEDRNGVKIENTNNLVYIISLYKSCRTCG
jgi:hypothetical protein